MMGLTHQARRLLDFIAAYVERNGIGPSFEEMRVGIGHSSKSEIYRLLNQLEERGRIQRIHGRSRAIEIIDPKDVPTKPVQAISLATMTDNSLMGLRADIDCELKRRREVA